MCYIFLFPVQLMVSPFLFLSFFSYLFVYLCLVTIPYYSDHEDHFIDVYTTAKMQNHIVLMTAFWIILMN